MNNRCDNLYQVDLSSHRQREKEAPTWNFNKADWRAYAHALDTRLESVDWNALTVEKANEALVNEIIRAARKSIPRGVRKKFTPGWTEDLIGRESGGRSIRSVVNRTFHTDFTIAELEGALRKSKKGKAPGRDGVTQEMLSHMGPKAKDALLRLYNRSWHSGTTPPAWRTAVVVPILKRGKKASDLASFRPISLTISKTMERMVNGRLYHYMEDSGLLDENQAGFRRHRSTVDQLVLFTQSVINAWHCNRHTVAVFVDLKNAYDRVWKGGLLLKLQRYGINGRMYNWLKGFLSNRYIRTKVNGVYSRTRPSKEGLPQGSALSCTLFLCFLNYLGEVIPTFNRLSFADDISTWQSDKNVDRATEALNRDLHALKRYCDQWCMQINTTKTVYNIYSNSREVLARDLELKIEDKCLQRDPLPRYLGVALDSRLNLTAHVEQLAGRVRERIGLMKKLPGTNWGATLSSLKTLYVTFVRSALEYANPILNLASKTSLGKLDRIQNAAMRLMTGGLRSTPIAVLEVATGCEPLETRREVQTLTARERFLRLGESNPLKDLAESFGAMRRLPRRQSENSTYQRTEHHWKLQAGHRNLPPPSGGSPRHWLERKEIVFGPPPPPPTKSKKPQP
ncbi:hypothetical protein RRG08_013674 [Elysia crispata]|uniref:Reverse transcriptase domain-containing protein n=1 Tax=Elysia crispata TaxID=231223 RepID=A0AAE1A1V5_9GAST|nr:hypothetical protein RRG08_013674 [Elysia crispata]